MKETDLLLFGRRMYQLMETSWPKAARDPNTSKENLEVANLMNNVNKIVFSKPSIRLRRMRTGKMLNSFGSLTQTR